MSDLHGHFSKFIRMLRHIKFDETDRMLVLGNVASGGPQPLELLIFISQQKNIKMCLGLHELLMLQALLENDLKIFNDWISNQDGKMTYEAYSALDEEKKHYVLNYLKESCPSFFTTSDFLLCSGGPKIWSDDVETNLKTEKPSFDDLMKKYDEQRSYLQVDVNFYRKAGFSDKTVIFGGTPVQQIRKNTDYKIWFDPIYGDKICIDSGVGIKPNKLACLRLNDMRDYYI